MKRGDLAAVSRIRASLVSGAAKSARIAADVRQREVAAELGVAASTVSQWESGKRTPAAEHALAYGRLLARLGKRAA